jgi:putative sterol carrier protein
MSEEMTVEKLMGLMPKAFVPDKAVGVDAVIQYKLSGDEAGEWIITIRDGACTVEKGEADEPRLTLMADSQDYINIITGKLNAMAAFAEGKLRLKGDLGLAMKLMDFFKLPA